MLLLLILSIEVVFIIFLILILNLTFYIMVKFKFNIFTMYNKKPSSYIASFSICKFKFVHNYSINSNSIKIKKNSIILSNKQDFIKNVYLHFICLNLSRYCKFTYNVFLYLSIFIFEEYLQFKGIKIPLNNIKELYVIKKRDFFYYISYIYNVINFYIKYPYFYLNLKIFINIFHNFLIILNLKLPFDFLLSETFIKYASIGFWSFFATAFAHKQYKRYTQYKINKNNLNKFFY